MIIEKKYHFYAAHRNKNAGEKCGRIHGHTYDVVCHFKFNEMKDGVTMLFSDIDKVVEPIIKQYDHHLLLFRDDSLCDVLNMNCLLKLVQRIWQCGYSIKSKLICQ